MTALQVYKAALEEILDLDLLLAEYPTIAHAICRRAQAAIRATVTMAAIPKEDHRPKEVADVAIQAIPAQHAPVTGFEAAAKVGDESEWQALVNAARIGGFLEGIKSTASHADERADAVERSPMANSPWAKAVVPALRVFAKDMRESADEAMTDVAPLTPTAPRGD